MPNGFVPAYAGVGAGQSRTYGGLWSRRHCVLFALLSLVAISLPYAGLGVATVRSILDPPATTIALPELTLPTAQFPVRALPKLADRTTPAAGARSSGTSAARTGGLTPAGTGATPSTARRTIGTRRVAGRRVATRHGRKVPVVTSSYSAPTAAPAKHRSPAQTAAGALAAALAGAPTVTNTAPPQPVMAPAPVVPVVPAPAATAPAALPAVTPAAPAVASVPVTAHAVGHLTSNSSGSSDTTPAATPPATTTTSSDTTTTPATTTPAATTPAATTPAATTPAATTPAATTPAATDTTAAPATTPASTATTAAPATTDTTAAPAAAPAAATTDAPATADTTAAPATTDPTAAPDPAATVAPPAQTTETAPPADAPDASAQSTDASTSSSGDAAGPTTSPDQTASPAADPSSTSAAANPTTPAADPAPGTDSGSSSTTPPMSTAPTSSADSGSPVQSAAATETVSAPVTAPADTASDQAAVATPTATTTLDTVSSPAEAAQLTAPATDATAFVAPATGTATVDLSLPDGSAPGADGQPTALDAPAAAAGSAVSAVSAAGGNTSASGADLSPTAGSAGVAGAAGATGGAPAGTAPDTTTPSVAETASLISDTTDSPATTDVNGLGARGPPGTYGPQLISAAQGGTIDAGDATLTFAPGSLPDDAYVTVTVTTGAATGLGAVSAIYNLTAVDAVTGAVIEHFATPPVLSIAVDSATGLGASVYYLPTGGAPQAISSSYDAATGQVTAGLPHFSTYAVLFSIQSVLENYLNGVITDVDHTFTPGDLVVGGVVDISAPTLEFQNISWQGSGSSATFSGTIMISAASATISTAPFTAAFGAVTGSYVLSGQAPDAGTLTLTLGGPSITVAGLASLAAATVELVSGDNGTTTTTTIGATNVTATVSAGTGGPAITVTVPAFGLVISDGDANGSTPQFALVATGSATLTGLTGVTLTGSGWTVTYDSLGDLSSSPISVPTGPGTSVNVGPAQPNGVTGAWSSFADTSASLAALTIAGQTVSGVFAVTAGGGQLTIAATDLGLTIGPNGSAYLTIPNSQTNANDPGAHGELIVSGAGLAGQLIVPSISLAVPSLTLSSASGQIEINTQAAAVAQSFTIDGNTATLDLPGGPFVGVTVTVDPTNPVTFGPGQIAGTLLFQQQVDNGVAADILAISNASLWLQGATAPVVTGGQGVVVIQSTGVAGYLSGAASVSAGTGFTGSGQVAVTINTTGGAVDQTITLNGQQMTISFGTQEGHVFSASVSGLSIDIGGYASLTGNATLGSFTTTVADGPVSGQAFAGTGLTAFFGNGPAFLPDGATNPLAVGVLLTNATVAVFTAVVSGTTDWAFTAQGTAQLIGVPGVTLSGQVEIRVNTFSQGFTETLTLAGGGTVPLDFASTEDASSGVAFTSVGGVGVSLGVGGQTITADITVSRPGGDLLLGIANAQVSLSDGSGNVSSRGPPFAQLTQGTGALEVTSAGIFGTVAGTVALNVPGVSFSGSLSLLVNTTAASQSITVGQTTTPLLAGPYFELSGSSVTLTIGSQSLTGTFALQQSTAGAITTTDITASAVTLTLAAGGTTVLALGSGTGTLSVTSAGVVGSLSASVTTNALSSFFTLSSIAIAVNTTDAPAGGLPAGPVVSAQADGAQLTLGGQTLSGNFGFQAGTDTSGHTVVAILASDVTLALGSVGSLTDGSGVILVTAGDGLAAALSGTLALNVPGVTAAGTFAVQIDSSGAAFTQGFSVGGQTVTLSLPAGSGPYVQVAATGATLDVLGQTVSGDLTVTVTSGSTPTIAIVIANGTVSLGGGLATITDLTGSLTLTPTDVSGPLSGTLAVTTPGVSLTAATVAVNVDTATSAFSVNATDLTATIAGQTITGNFSLAVATDAAGHPEILIAFDNPVGGSEGPLLTLAAGGTTFATVANGDGQLIITAAGVAGALEVSGVSLAGLPATVVGNGATFSIQISTLPTAVSQAFQVGSATPTLSLPAGPYVSLEADNLELEIGSATFTGSFAFTRQVATDGTPEITLAATGITVNAGPASLTGGSGAFVLASGGVAGMLTGAAAAGDTSGGASVSGTVVLRVNSTTAAFDETVTVAGQPLEIRFAGTEIASGGTPFIALSVSSLTLTIGSFVSVQGAISYTNGAFAGDGLTVFIGQGPAYLASGAINPLATGLLITDAQIGLVQGMNGTYALVATGTATVLGASGITLTGTVTVTFNNTGGPVDQTIAIPGSTSPGVTVNLVSGTPGAPLESATLTNGQIAVAGQTLSGSFAFTPVPGGVSIAASGVALSLGSGLLSVTGGNGTFVIASGGIAGSVTATVTATIAGVRLTGGTDTIDINTTTAEQTVTVAGQPSPVTLPAGPFLRVDAVGATISLFNQTQSFGGNFAIESTTVPGAGAALSIAATGVHATLGTTLTGATLSGGTGELLATSAGLAGALSGQVQIALPAAVTLSGTIGLAVNTTTSAVNQTFTVDGQTLSLVLPGGPYLELSGTNVTITAFGQTITGSVAIQQVTSTATNPSTTVVEIGVSGASLTIGGATPILSMTGVSGLLVLEPTGSTPATTVAGTLSGTVVLNVPGVALSGTLAVTFNTGTGPVTDSLVVGGTPVAINVAPGAKVAITGTGVSLTVLGQTITADVTITTGRDAHGQPVADIGLANLTATFGGAAGSPVLTVVQTSAPATLELSSAGIAGSIAVGLTLANVPGLALSATAFSLAINTTSAAAAGVPAGPFLQVGATGASVAILGQSVTADITVTQTTDGNGASVVTVAIANGSLTLAAGAVAVSAINGLVMVTGAGVAGTLSATVSLAASDAITLGGTFSLAVNTTSKTITDSIPVAGGTESLDLPVGPYFELTATDAVLRVDNQSLSGDITISQSSLPVLANPTIPAGQSAPDPTGANVTALQITVANGSLTLGDGAQNFVVMTGIAGTLLAFDGAHAQQSVGSATPTVLLNGVVGQLSGSVVLQNVTGVAFSATMGLSLNSTGVTVDAVVTPPNGTAAQLTWMAATTFQISATHVSLTVLGQTITGDLTLTVGSDMVQAAFANVSLSLGGGLLTVTNGQGTLDIISGASGGIYGVVSGTVALTVPGAAFSGTVGIDLNTTSSDHSVTVNATPVTVTHGQLVITSSSATFIVGGQSVNGTWVGGQSIGGTFTIAATTAGGQTVVSVEVTDVTLQLGPSGSPFVNIQAVNAVSGAVIISSAGVAGQFSGTATTTNPIFTNLPSDLAITPGAFAITFNTESVAVDETLAGGSTINVAAGPFLAVSIANASATIAGLSASGSFSFTEGTPAGQSTPVTEIGISGLGITLTPTSGGSGAVKLTGGQGAFVLTTVGVAGVFSGSVGAGSANGNVGASATVRFNGTTGTVNDTITVGGATIPVIFASTEEATDATHPWVAIAGSASVTLGNPPFVEIEGSFTAGTGSNAHVSPSTIFVFMGQGPAFESDGTTPNPTAKGVYLNLASYSSTASSGTETAFSATGSITLAGFSGLTLSGSGISMSWTSGATSVSFSGDMTLILPGISLTGAMGFSYSGGVFTIELGTAVTGGDGTPVTFDLGAQAADGSYPVQATIASGALSLSAAGIVADVTATLTLNVPGLDLSLPAVSVAINTTNAPVSQNDPNSNQAVVLPAQSVEVVAGASNSLATLTVMHQSIQGVFAFSQVVGSLSPQAQPGSHPPITVWVSASDVSLTLGSQTGGVTLSNGQGLLLITAQGLAGQIGGSVQFHGLPNSATFGGTFDIALNTTAVAVNQQATLFGAGVSLILPAGPYVQITGTGVTLTLAGQTISGTFAITAASQAGATVAEITATNVSAALGNGTTSFVTLSGGSGTLVLNANGLAGQISGNVAVSVPGVTLTGTLSLVVNTGNQPVTETIGNAVGPDGATAAVLGDVNGDGRPDLIVATSTGQKLLYLNQGGASPFSAPSDIVPAGSDQTTALALADVNGDGVADLIVGNGNGATEVYLGDGQGDFTAAVLPSDAPAGSTIAPGTAVTSLVVTDVNGDKLPDLIVVTGGQVDEYINAGADANGDWQGFAAAARIGSITGASAIAVGDVNGDGAPDLIVGIAAGPTQLWLDGMTAGTANGTFTQDAGVSLGSDATAVAAANLNADGYADVVVSTASATTVYLTTGAATFTAGATGFPAAATIDIADVNGDGHLDIVLGSATGATILLGNGTGGFTVASGPSFTLPAGFDTTAVAAGDLNGDGHPDLVLVSGQLAQGIDVLLGQTGGTLGPAAQVGAVTLTVPRGPYLDLQGTAVSLNFLGQTITGSLSIEQVTTGGAQTVEIAITSASWQLGGVGTIAIPSGDLLITPTGIAGSIALSTPSLSLGAVTVSGTLSLQINTMSAPAALSSTVELPAGPYFELAGSGLTIALGTGAGAPSLAGSFTIEQVQDNSGHTTLLLGASGVSVNFGGSLNGIVTGASGILVVLPGATGGLAGSLQGTVDLSSLLPAGVSLSGTFGFTINQTSQAVAESVTVAGQQVSVNAPAGPYLEITATGAQLNVLGETLSGSFAVQRTGTTTILTASGVAMALGAGGAPFVTLSGGSGEIDVSGGGLAGVLSGSVGLQIPGLTLAPTDTFTVEFNTTNAAVTLQSGAVVPLGPFIEFTGSSVTATILGQTVSGAFTFSRDSAGTVHLGITNLQLTLGTSTFGVAVSQQVGQTASLTVGSAGVTGSIAATVSLIGTSPISFGSGIPIAVVFSPGSLFVQLGTLNADGTVNQAASLTVLSQQISGVFTLRKTTDAGLDGILNTSDDRTILQLSAVGVSASLGTATVGATLSGGTALFLLTPTGFAGQASGAVTLSLGSSITASVANALFAVSTITSADQRDLQSRRRAVDPQPPGRPVRERLADRRLADDQRPVADRRRHLHRGRRHEHGHLRQRRAAARHRPGGLRRRQRRRRHPDHERDRRLRHAHRQRRHHGAGGRSLRHILVALNTTGASQTLGSVPTRQTLAAGVTVTGAPVTLSVLGQTLTGNVIFVDDTADHVIAHRRQRPEAVARQRHHAVRHRHRHRRPRPHRRRRRWQPHGHDRDAGDPVLRAELHRRDHRLDQRDRPGDQPDVQQRLRDAEPRRRALVRVDVGSDAAPAKLTVLGQTITAHAWFVQLKNSAGDSVVALGLDQGPLTLGTGNDTVSVTGASGLADHHRAGAGRQPHRHREDHPGLDPHRHRRRHRRRQQHQRRHQSDLPRRRGRPGELQPPAGPFVRVTPEQRRRRSTCQPHRQLLLRAGDRDRRDGRDRVRRHRSARTPARTFTVSGALIVDSASGGMAGVLQGTPTASSIGLRRRRCQAADQHRPAAVDQTMTVAGSRSRSTSAAAPVYEVEAQLSLNLDNLVEIYGTFDISAAAPSSPATSRCSSATGRTRTPTARSTPRRSASSSPTPRSLRYNRRGQLRAVRAVRHRDAALVGLNGLTSPRRDAEDQHHQRRDLGRGPGRHEHHDSRSAPRASR